jgi:hypothetical protein
MAITIEDGVHINPTWCIYVEKLVERIVLASSTGFYAGSAKIIIGTIQTLVTNPRDGFVATVAYHTTVDREYRFVTRISHRRHRYWDDG